jgi:hypothetical protein
MAETLAVGWSHRVERIAMLSTPPRLGGMPTSPFWHARLQWYHWFQATRRGAQAVRENPKGFARLMWETWSPKGWVDEATFNRVSASFDNPDWVDVTLHSYRSRWDEANPDPTSQWLDDKVKQTKTLALPAIYFQGELDGVNPPRRARGWEKSSSGRSTEWFWRESVTSRRAKRLTKSLRSSSPNSGLTLDRLGARCPDGHHSVEAIHSG